MKVLLAPQIGNISYSLMTRQLIPLLLEKEITVGVCALDKMSSKVSFFPALPVRSPFFNFGAENRAHEEWMYSCGQMSEKYLKADVETFLESIEDFKPDILVCMDRPACLIAGLLTKTPCICFVHSAMYKKAVFPSHCMHGLNKVLSFYGLEQELSLHALYSKAKRRVGFGPVQISPFHVEEDITRIGSMCPVTHKKPRTNKLCIYFTEMKNGGKSLEKIISSAYLGAPYQVYACYPGCTSKQDGNIRYLSRIDTELMKDAVAFIHDGNDFLYNQAVTAGLPQIMISNHEYVRIYDALSLERNHAGIFLDEADLSMASLYETYRELITDDQFYEQAQLLRQKTLKEKDISQFIDFLYIDTL